MKPSLAARKAAKHIATCFEVGQYISPARIASIIDNYYNEPSFLDKLIPEMAGKTISCLDSGLVLIRLENVILLVLTREEYKQAIGRGKGIIRARKYNVRVNKIEETIQ